MRAPSQCNGEGRLSCSPILLEYCERGLLIPNAKCAPQTYFRLSKCGGLQTSFFARASHRFHLLVKLKIIHFETTTYFSVHMAIVKCIRRESKNSSALVSAPKPSWGWKKLNIFAPKTVGFKNHCVSQNWKHAEKVDQEVDKFTGRFRMLRYYRRQLCYFTCNKHSNNFLNGSTARSPADSRAKADFRGIAGRPVVSIQQTLGPTISMCPLFHPNWPSPKTLSNYNNSAPS